MAEVHLALVLPVPRHGYEVKREHDAWFPKARPLAFGQVYATLGRLVRDGLAEVVEAPGASGRKRTVYAVTDAGRVRLDAWLAEPAPPAGSGGEEMVRKVVVALRARVDARDLLLAQRASHLRQMAALQAPVAGDGVAPRMARRHAALHLDADLRWLEETIEALPTETDLWEERS
ncbi:PadR family transcriptional regulator [Pseudokineococcus sp. 1T1Z-3]|uniref:PadR family transcriptional regulator n=1 Tax=Pseudokineococcus sp. 1T1Z-3 TaxID=3132745 RepID=UPI0030B0CD1B